MSNMTRDKLAFLPGWSRHREKANLPLVMLEIHNSLLNYDERIGETCSRH